MSLNLKKCPGTSPKTNDSKSLTTKEFINKAKIFHTPPIPSPLISFYQFLKYFYLNELQPKAQIKKSPQINYANLQSATPYRTKDPPSNIKKFTKKTLKTLPN